MAICLRCQYGTAIISTKLKLDRDLQDLQDLQDEVIGADLCLVTPTPSILKPAFCLIYPKIA